jgi:hypothetical protein
VETATASPRRRAAVVALNVGIVLVFLSIPLPWARIAGQTRSGPAFADLLLGLPDIPRLGSYLRAVAALWYALPLLALATWLTQFRTWPPAATRATVVAASALAVAVALLMVWSGVRAVGFPSVGGLVASAGAALALGAAAVGRSRGA